MIDEFNDREQWDSPQHILIVLAHPDDPEFYCGASIARWTQAGHTVDYCLLTCGDKGTKNRDLTSKELCLLRRKEQIAAGSILGVQKIIFLNYEDGYLSPTLELRRDITRVIRQVQPDILVTCDPRTLFIGGSRLNHPDHRAAGQAALDSVFPAARDHLIFVELWRDEHLEPHNVREVWVCGTLEPNTFLDVTDTWEIKIQAICEHESQIGDRAMLAERVRQRLKKGSTLQNPRYEENFLRLIIG